MRKYGPRKAGLTVVILDVRMQMAISGWLAEEKN